MDLLTHHIYYSIEMRICKYLKEKKLKFIIFFFTIRCEAIIVEKYIFMLIFVLDYVIIKIMTVKINSWSEK